MARERRRTQDYILLQEGILEKTLASALPQAYGDKATYESWYDGGKSVWLIKDGRLEVPDLTKYLQRQSSLDEAKSMPSCSSFFDRSYASQYNLDSKVSSPARYIPRQRTYPSRIRTESVTIFQLLSSKDRRVVGAEGLYMPPSNPNTQSSCKDTWAIPNPGDSSGRHISTASSIVKQPGDSIQVALDQEETRSAIHPVNPKLIARFERHERGVNNQVAFERLAIPAPTSLKTDARDRHKSAAITNGGFHPEAREPPTDTGLSRHDKTWDASDTRVQEKRISEIDVEPRHRQQQDTFEQDSVPYHTGRITSNQSSCTISDPRASNTSVHGASVVERHRHKECKSAITSGADNCVQLLIAEQNTRHEKAKESVARRKRPQDRFDIKHETGHSISIVESNRTDTRGSRGRTANTSSGSQTYSRHPSQQPIDGPDDDDDDDDDDTKIGFATGESREDGRPVRFADLEAKKSRHATVDASSGVLRPQIISTRARREYAYER